MTCISMQKSILPNFILWLKICRGIINCKRDEVICYCLQTAEYISSKHTKGLKKCFVSLKEHSNLY
jgi:hypothetical protein